MVKNRIGEVRRIKGFTQQQLADEVNKRRNAGNVRRTDISMIETGKRGFSSKLLELIAEILEVEIGDLFFTSCVSNNDTKDR